jgi:UDP:flavonoid glycosyltransferase YjiC (YdhE family)
VRILVSSYGSAGDLFPVIPLVQALIDDGHDVRCAVPRALGLYLRPHGLPVIGLGAGSELRALSDRRLITARFDGWDSWRRVADTYLADTVAADVALLERVMATWRPDLVVSTTFAAAARVAACRSDLPRREVTVSPQHLDRLPRAKAFARHYRRAVARALGSDGGAHEADLVTALAWGAGARTTLLHDRALIADTADAGGARGPAVGFPYWDAGPERPGDRAEVRAWLDRSSAPVVLVTLGSFLGIQPAGVRREATEAARALGLRVLLVGPQRDAVPEAGWAADDVLAVGFVRLSELVSRVAAVVHHGGIGTMFAALRAGRPAVVVPQAFDQAFNARSLAGVGAGVVGAEGSLREALAVAVGDASVARRAREVAEVLVPSGVATRRAVERVLA